MFFSHNPFSRSPTKAGGMFSGMKTQMSGWLGNAAIPTMPSMPAMPAMPAIPSMPTIPGLRKAGPAAGEASDAAAAAADEAALQTDGLDAAGGAGADDEDRSRYIRYGPSAKMTVNIETNPRHTPHPTPQQQQQQRDGHVQHWPRIVFLSVTVTDPLS